MRDEFARFLHELDSSGIEYCVIDVENENLDILVSESFEAVKLKIKGWKEKKDRKLYLYSLKRRKVFIKDALTVSFNYKLACRSTLNGAWVPLDRRINDGALERAIFDTERGFRVLSPEDEVCYLLASCIYTIKGFSSDHRSRISDSMKRGDAEEIKKKLSKVFFYFTDRLLQMVKDRDYDDIIPALYAFAGY